MTILTGEIPVRVIHFIEGHDCSPACGHYLGPVKTIWTDEVTCGRCKATEDWKKRHADPGSHYANFNPYYVTEYSGPLPEGTMDNNGGFAVRRIFRTRKELESIPEKHFNLIRCPEAINEARVALLNEPQAKHNNWNYEPWNDRDILVEVSIQ